MDFITVLLQANAPNTNMNRFTALKGGVILHKAGAGIFRYTFGYNFETKTMIDHKTIDELSNKLSEALPDGVKLMRDDFEKNIRAILESTFSKMNIISREEFDVQTAVLARTREKLEQLEKQIKELENTD